MKEKTSDRVSKIALIVIGVPFLIVCLLGVTIFLNSLFGNPISLNLAKKSALEYIEREYPDSDCIIEDVYFDGKYADYVAHIISPTKDHIDFSLYLNSQGEIRVIEYWVSPSSYADIMTEEQIKQMYLTAHDLYAEWFSPNNNLIVDWDNVTIIDDIEYFEVNSTEITSVEELKEEFGKYFDREDFDEIIDRFYVMHNGKMYGMSFLLEGDDIPWESHKMTININTNTECDFTITSYNGDEKQELDYRLKVIDGNWKFTGAFHWVTTDTLVLVDNKE